MMLKEKRTGGTERGGGAGESLGTWVVGEAVTGGRWLVATFGLIANGTMRQIRTESNPTADGPDSP